MGRARAFAYARPKSAARQSANVLLPRLSFTKEQREQKEVKAEQERKAEEKRMWKAAAQTDKDPSPQAKAIRLVLRALSLLGLKKNYSAGEVFGEEEFELKFKVLDMGIVAKVGDKFYRAGESPRSYQEFFKWYHDDDVPGVEREVFTFYGGGDIPDVDQDVFEQTLPILQTSVEYGRFRAPPIKRGELNRFVTGLALGKKKNADLLVSLLPSNDDWKWATFALRSAMEEVEFDGLLEGAIWPAADRFAMAFDVTRGEKRPLEQQQEADDDEPASKVART